MPRQHVRAHDTPAPEISEHPAPDSVAGRWVEASTTLEARGQIRSPSPGASPSSPFLGNTRESRPALCDKAPGDPGDFERQQRRERRYCLRELNWDLSPIRRVRLCGRIPGRRADGSRGLPEIRAAEENVCYWSGVGRCGSVWACPVCSAKIRHERTLEVEAGMQKWLAEDNSVVFFTLTMPHDFGESCGALMDTVSAAFSSVFSGRPYKRDRDRFGIVHSFRAWDATHGRNGWHPHIHGALFVEGHLDRAAIVELEESVFARWVRAVTSRGHRSPSKEHGIRLEEAHRVKDLAGYLLKVQGEDTGASLAMELTRGDLKAGRGRSPFQILQGFADTGDLGDLELFREWVEATKGKHFTRWSDGARTALSVEELQDQDLVEMDVGGVTIYCLGPDEWHALTGTPGALCEALRVAEAGGAVAVATYVAAVREKWCDRRRRAA